jgi:hypothetical protein
MRVASEALACLAHRHGFFIDRRGGPTFLQISSRFAPRVLRREIAHRDRGPRTGAGPDSHSGRRSPHRRRTAKSGRGRLASDLYSYSTMLRQDRDDSSLRFATEGAQSEAGTEARPTDLACAEARRARRPAPLISPAPRRGGCPTDLACAGARRARRPAPLSLTGPRPAPNVAWAVPVGRASVPAVTGSSYTTSILRGCAAPGPL